MVTQVNIEVRNNVAWIDAFQFGFSRDKTWSFTGKKFILDVKVKASDTVPVLALSSADETIVVDDVANRKLHLQVPSSTMGALMDKSYVYDLVMVDNTTGKREVLIKGHLKVVRGVTGATGPVANPPPPPPPPVGVTRNIKLDFGAVGDGQIATVGLSINIGTKALSSNTDLWVAGDQNKAIAFSYPTDPGISFMSTIDAVIDAKHVTLHDVFSDSSFSNSLQTVEWGTDDAVAFSRFSDWRVTQTDPVELTIPLGRYLFATHVDPVGPGFGSGRWAAGVGQLTVSGSGNPAILGSGAVLSSMRSQNGFFWAGGRAINNTFAPHTLMALSGDTSVLLKNPGQAVLYTVGQHAIMTGIEMQPYGFPPNYYFCEHVLVTSTNASTGVIGFASPLKNDYMETWPEYTINPGGPATLFPTWPDWNATLVYNDITIQQEAIGTISSAYSMTFNRVVSLGPLGISPTDNVFWTTNDCDLSTNHMEIDKLIENLSFKNTPVGSMSIASTGGSLALDNCSTTLGLGVNGTFKNTNITNSHINSLGLGAFEFGSCDKLNVSSSTINSLITHGAGEGFGLNNFYTMSGGVIIVPKDVRISAIASNGVGGTRFTCASTGGLITGKSTQVNQFDHFGSFVSSDTVQVTIIDATHFDTPLTFNPLAITGVAGNGNSGAAGWAIPGKYAYWSGQYENEGIFKVIALTDDANNTYIHTDQVGGFPSVPLLTGLLLVHDHPAPDFTMRNCIGCPDVVDLSQAPANSPIFSYSQRSYSGNTLLPYPNNPLAARVWGNGVSIRINVSQAYTGIQSSLALQAMDYATLQSDLSFFRYTPSINLKKVGTRVITPAGVTGAQSGDSALSLPGPVWFADRFVGPNISADVSAEASSVWPIVSIEIQTDQGLT